MKDGLASVSVVLGADTWFTCDTYDTDPTGPPMGPILAISTPGLSLELSNRTPGAVLAEDVQNARGLLGAVALFTAEVERLYALNTEPVEPAAPAPNPDADA